MQAYIARRVAYGIFILFVISFLAFALMYLSGDPVRLMAPDYFTDQQIEDLRAKLDLDRPFLVLYADFLKGMVHGDLGESILQQRSALTLVVERIPNTVKLAVGAFVLSVLISIPLGVTAGVHRATLWDRAALILALAGQSVPSFWFAMLLILVVGLRLHLLPIFGAESWKNLIMPIITLSLRYTGVMTRLSRSAMVEVLGEDYIRTARSKGLAERTVVYKHALRNAALPIITVAGLELGGLLSGSVITETVFAYPGVGWLAIQAIRSHDFPIVRVFVMVVAAFFLAANLLVDLMYAVLDPRVVYD